MYVKSNDGLVVQLTKRMEESEIFFDEDSSRNLIRRLHDFYGRIYWIYNKQRIDFQLISQISNYELSSEHIRLLKLHTICNL